MTKMIELFGYINQRYGGTLRQLVSMVVVEHHAVGLFCFQWNWCIAQSGCNNEELQNSSS